MSSRGLVVASTPRWGGPHCPGRVNLRSERPGITGAMGSSTSWNPWPRPVTRAAVGTQECTQIGENGPSEPFRGVCVHCCAVVDRREAAGVYTDRRKWPLGAILGHSCTHCCNASCDASFATRAASGGTSASTAMACRRHPLDGRLSLGRKNRLCASGAAARLASSPRHQPTQIPEEPLFFSQPVSLTASKTLSS